MRRRARRSSAPEAAVRATRSPAVAPAALLAAGIVARTVLEDRAGQVWAGTYGGLVRLPADTNSPRLAVEAAAARGLDCMVEKPMAMSAGEAIERHCDLVLRDEDKCKGAQNCARACPYKKIYFNAARNVSQHCIGCFPRIDQGVAPACVRQCPGRAAFVGFLDDQNGPIYKLVKQWKVALPLHPEYGTEPNVYYVPSLQVPHSFNRQMFGPGTLGMAKWSAEIQSADRVPEYVARAFHTATQGRPGPVVLSLPEDMLTTATAAPVLARSMVAAAWPAPGPLRDLRQLLLAARQPLVIAGGSGWDAEACAALQRFAEGWNLPVACAFRFQDLFDNRHANYAGDVGIGKLGERETGLHVRDPGAGGHG